MDFSKDTPIILEHDNYRPWFLHQIKAKYIFFISGMIVAMSVDFL